MTILNLPNFKVTETEERAHDYRVKAEYTVPLEKCLHCDSANLHRFGPRPVLFMDLPVHAKRVGVEVRRQRYRCVDCKRISLQPLPDIDEKRDATKRLLAWIRNEALSRTFSSISQDVGIAVNTVRDIALEYIEQLDMSYKPETPVWLGIDEVHAIGAYRCVLTNVQVRTLLDMLINRNKTTLAKRIEQFENRKLVEAVTLDMWRPYPDVCDALLPQAKKIVDKFHVVRLANDGMEAVRKSVRAELSDKRRRKLKDDRFILLRRFHDLDDFQKWKLEAWSSEFPLLGTAHGLKEGFYGIYDAPDRFEAKERYRAWLMSIPKALEPYFKELTRAVRNWEDCIFNYFDMPRAITNAYTESMNSIVRMVEMAGRGYSFKRLRAKMLYLKGTHKVMKPTFKRKKWEKRDTALMVLPPKPLPSSYPELEDMIVVVNPEMARTFRDFGADISTVERLVEGGRLDAD